MISAPLAAAKTTEVPPTAYKTSMSPDAKACVCSAPDVISAYLTSISLPFLAKVSSKISLSFWIMLGTLSGDVTCVIVNSSNFDCDKSDASAV